MQPTGQRRGLRQTSNVNKALLRMYKGLLAHYGAQNWWPADSKWEIMVGAILTQNTSWKNVEKALANLKRAEVLTPARLHAVEIEVLTELLRPAGFVTSKPKRLKTLAEFLLREYAGDPQKLRAGDLAVQRAQLLALNGIGPETADAILLYVAEQPIFVVDAYTRRIVRRMGIWDAALQNIPAKVPYIPGTERTPIRSTSPDDRTERTPIRSLPGNIPYHELQALFIENLPPDVLMFSEFHALLDVHAKSLCTKRAPCCGECPLNRMCEKRLDTGE